jgi:hypothetical protein
MIFCPVSLVHPSLSGLRTESFELSDESSGVLNDNDEGDNDKDGITDASLPPLVAALSKNEVVVVAFGVQLLVLPELDVMFKGTSGDGIAAAAEYPLDGPMHFRWLLEIDLGGRSEFELVALAL